MIFKIRGQNVRRGEIWGETGKRGGGVKYH